MKYYIHLICNMVKYSSVRGHKHTLTESSEDTARHMKKLANTFQSEDFANSYTIKPTDGESVFESYLSILITLLGTQNIYRDIVKLSNSNVCIQEVKGKDNNPKPEPKNINSIIYFYKPTGNHGTHYRVYSYEVNSMSRRKHYKWTTIDPYDLYQKNKSHGFCQMFAYFIAINDTNDFIDKTKNVGKINEKDIHKHNTYECLQKTILLLETIPKKIFNDIKKEFKDLEKDPIYGIPSKMKLELFIQNLKQFQLHDLDNYIDSLK